MGFAVPLDTWLRGPLRNWAEELLYETQIDQGGYFEAKIVDKTWRTHLAGTRDLQHQLWPILMFQAWLRQQKR